MSASTVITAEQLKIGWSPQAVLLEHADFEVHRGEVFGILGRSASGKTTLLRALIGLDEPLAGTIRFADGRPPQVGAGRPRYGVMFQQGALFGSMTVGANVALPLERWTRLPPDATEAVVRSRLHLVGLDAAVDQLPDTLSGGMRKRAAMARALTLEPELLFLDEPSSGLDPITSAELDRLIGTCNRVLGVTVVLVTHELGSILSIVDRCILLDNEERRIIATGAPRDLSSSPDPRVRRFFTRSAGELE